MNVKEGSIVTIEGSDTTWIVISVDKSKCNLADEAMGIIELEDIDISEITGVVEYDEVP